MPNKSNRRVTSKKYAEASTETIMEEIIKGVKELNKIFGPYEDIGDGLETQIHLRQGSNQFQILYTLNDNWSVTMKNHVEKSILEIAGRYPNIIIEQ